MRLAEALSVYKTVKTFFYAHRTSGWDEQHILSLKLVVSSETLVVNYRFQQKKDTCTQILMQPLSIYFL